MVVSPPQRRSANSEQSATLYPQIHSNENESTSHLQFFLKQDKYFNFLIEKGICDREGNPIGRFKEYIFKTLPSDHPIYQTFSTNINFDSSILLCTKNMTDLIEFLEKKSQQNYFEYSKEKNLQKFNHPIIDVQIIGSKFWSILIQHPDILEKLYSFIEDSLEAVEFKQWIVELISKKQKEASLGGKETDIRILLPKETKFSHLEMLSKEAENFFLNHFQDCGSIIKFAKIPAASTTLIAFRFHTGEERELIFTSHPNAVSLGNSGFLSLKGKQTIGFLGANENKSLLAELHDTYFPFDLTNPEALLRFYAKDEVLSLDNCEQEMLNTFFCDLNLVKNEQEYLEFLRKKDYEKFNTFPPLFITCMEWPKQAYLRYLYMHICKRMRAKSDMQDQFPNNRVLFIFRFCQGLATHQKLSDTDLQALISWLNLENVVCTEKTDSILRFFFENLITQYFSFSEFLALQTIMAYLFHYHSFTVRQNPPLFCIRSPFAFRIPADLVNALVYLNSLHEREDFSFIIQNFYLAFNTTNEDNLQEHQVISEILKVDSRFAQTTIQKMLNHHEPIIKQFGLQIEQIFYPHLACSYYIQFLPDLLKLTDRNFLSTLYQRFLQNHQFSFSSLAIPIDLSDWIKFLATSFDPQIRRHAYDLWSNSELNKNPKLTLFFIKKFAKTEPIFALNLLSTHSFKDEEFTSYLKILIMFKESYPIYENFNKSVYPIIIKLLDYFPEKLEIHHQQQWADFLNTFAICLSLHKKRFLLVKTFTLSNSSLSALLHHYTENLKTLVPFLNLRTLDNEKKSKLLSYFDVKDQKKLPNEVCESWMQLLMNAFYPVDSEMDSHSLSISVQTLIAFLNSLEVDLDFIKLLYDVMYTATQPRRVVFPLKDSSTLQTVIKDLSILLDHPHAMIKIVALQNFLSLNIDENSFLFFEQLPRLLNNSPLYQTALQNLYQRIFAEDHQKNTEFQLDSLNDWIISLCHSKNLLYICLAKRLWQENIEQPGLKKNIDLIIFKVFTEINIQQAINHLYEILIERQPPLSVGETIFCLNQLKNNVKSPTASYENLFSLLNLFLKRIADTKKILSTREKAYVTEICHFFAFALQSNENNENGVNEKQSFMIDSLTNNFLSVDKNWKEIIKIMQETSIFQTNEKLQKICLSSGQYLLKNNNLYCRIIIESFLFSANLLVSGDAICKFVVDYLEKFYQQEDIKTLFFWLYKVSLLDKISYLKSKPELLRLAFTKLCQTQNLDLATQEVNYIDAVIIKYSDSFATMKKACRYLFFYLKKTKNSDRSTDIYKILEKFIHHMTPLEFLPLVALVSTQTERELPAFIIHYFNTLKPNAIEIFQTNKNWQMVKFFLSFYKRKEINADLQTKIFDICKEILQTQIQDKKETLFPFLEIYSLNDWRLFLKANLFEELKAFLPLIITQLLQELKIEKKEEVRKKIADLVLFFLDYQLKNSKLAMMIDTQLLHEVIPYLHISSISSLLKKYFYLHHAHIFSLETSSAFNIHEIIKKEIYSKLSEDKIDFSYCFELLKKYFISNSIIYLDVFQRLAQSKNSEIIESALSLLFAYRGQKDATIDKCWAITINLLKVNHHAKIWDFFIPFSNCSTVNVKSFDTAIQSTLVEGASLQIEAQQNKNQRKVKTAVVEMWETRKKNLIQFVFKETSLPLKTFQQFFSIISEIDILTYPQEILVKLLYSFHTLTPEELHKFPFSELFTKKLNLFFKKIAFHHQNNKPLIPYNQSNENLTLLFEISLQLKLLQLHDLSDCSYLAEDILKESLEAVKTSQDQQDKLPDKIYFTTYQNVLEIIDLEKPSIHTIISQTIRKLSEIHQSHLRSNVPEETQLLIASLFDVKHSQIPLNYFSLLLQSINQLENYPHICKLKVLLVKQILSVLDFHSKQKNSILLQHVKTLFQKGIDYDIDYYFKEINATQSLSPKLYISLISTHSLFKHDLWFSKIFHLFNPECTDFPYLTQAQLHNQVVNLITQLTSYSHHRSLSYAIKIYFCHVYLNVLYTDELRFSLYKKILNAVFEHPIVLVDDLPLFDQMHSNRFVLHNLLYQNNYSLVKIELFYHMSNLELDQILTCLQSFSQSIPFNFGFFHYYTNKGLEVFKQKTLHDLYTASIEDLQKLKKFLPFVYLLEKYFLNKHYESYLDAPISPSKNFFDLLFEITKNSPDLQKYRNEIIEEILNDFCSFSCDESHIGVVVNRQNLIANMLLNISQFFNRNLGQPFPTAPLTEADKKFKNILNCALAWLNNNCPNPLVIDLINYSFIVCEYEKEVALFNQFKAQLFTNEYIYIDLVNLYFILQNRIKNNFSLDPKYKKLSIEFLFDHFNFHKSFVNLETGINLMTNYFVFLSEKDILCLDDKEFDLFIRAVAQIFIRNKVEISGFIQTLKMVNYKYLEQVIDKLGVYFKVETI